MICKFCVSGQHLRCSDPFRCTCQHRVSDNLLKPGQPQHNKETRMSETENITGTFVEARYLFAIAVKRLIVGIWRALHVPQKADQKLDEVDQLLTNLADFRSWAAS